MPTLIAGVVAVVLLYLLLQMFRAANPVVLARGIKIVGGVVALAVAAFTGLRGELAVAIPLGIFGAGLLGWSPFGPGGFSIGGIFGGGGQRSAGQASRVRSQFLDMSLDHDSGELSGRIVDGPNAGRSLDEFDLPQLIEMTTGFEAEPSNRTTSTGNSAAAIAAGRNPSQPQISRSVSGSGHGRTRSAGGITRGVYWIGALPRGTSPETFPPFDARPRLPDRSVCSPIDA